MINGEQVPFTRKEELDRDAEEAQWIINRAAEDVRVKKRNLFEAKLKDDSISFNELKELLRLRG
jgi:hypothetical protein